MYEKYCYYLYHLPCFVIWPFLLFGKGESLLMITLNNYFSFFMFMNILFLCSWIWKASKLKILNKFINPIFFNNGLHAPTTKHCMYNCTLQKIKTNALLVQTCYHSNPILTVNLTPPPPARNPRLPRDRRRSRYAFSWLFSFKSCASFDTKFAKIGPSVARSRDVLYSHVGTKFAQNLHFA